MNNIDKLKKKIIYRSKHRGTKELDLILGKFVEKYIDDLALSELKDLDDFLHNHDEDIYNLYFNKNSKNKIFNSKISVLFRNFKI